MAEKTGIAWTRSTRNLWTGCTKVGPGCDGCYAESFQRFVRGKNQETGQAINWGPGAPRFDHLVGAFKDLRRWNRKAIAERLAGTTWAGRLGFWPVFLNSQSDFFDNDVPDAWREQSFPVLEECSALTLFLVTKRIGNVAKMVPSHWMRDGFPAHVRLIITAVNKEEVDRDLPKLLELPCRNGLSYEPALGPVAWPRWLTAEPRHLEWLIVGGESNQGSHRARDFRVTWASDAVHVCRRAGVAVFVKQMGSRVLDRNDADFDGSSAAAWPLVDGAEREVDYAPHGHEEQAQGADVRVILRDPTGSDPTDWPRFLRRQEFPS